MKQIYDFPVALEPAYLNDGRQIPNTKAVMRRDTNEYMATVTDKYTIIPYKELVDKAEGFIRKFGEPQRDYQLHKNGVSMVGTYTYKEKTAEVSVGDLVGMRVYIKNSYNKNSSALLRIGALRLKCLNGMVSSNDIYEMSIRHSGKGLDGISFPDPDLIIDSYEKAVERWALLSDAELSLTEYHALMDKAVEEHVVPERALSLEPTVDKDMAPSAWKLYNHFTYYINHEEKQRASAVGKMSRLDKVDRFFNKHFVN